MKSQIFFCIVTLSAAMVIASPARDTNNNNQNRKKNPQFEANTKCAIVCSDEYKPICATNGDKALSFGNECVLGKYNCEHKSAFIKSADNECPNGESVRLS